MLVLLSKLIILTLLTYAGTRCMFQFSINYNAARATEFIRSLLIIQYKDTSTANQNLHGIGLHLSLVLCIQPCQQPLF